MDVSSSSINQRWRLCKLAGLLGCIVLILFVNYGRQNVAVPTLESVAISVTPPVPSMSHELITVAMSVTPPVPSMSHELIATVVEEEETSGLLNGTEKKKEEEKECNVFDGRWVYDEKGTPLYDSSICPFLSDQVSCQRNGRPDFEYEKWSWEAERCQIPKFNGKDMLKRLKGKRVIIVGDSLNRNQWESLACLLYSSIHPSRARVDVRSSVYKIFRALDYKCSVEFYWSPFLVQLEGNKQVNNGSRILKLDQVSDSAERWKGADVMVFNTGHWWVHNGKLRAWDFFQHDEKLEDNMEIEKAFGMGMNTWARWIDQNVDATKTKVFFRSISPDHKGKQWCYNRTQPIINENPFYISSTFPKPITDIVEITIGGMKTSVHYLNITNLSQYRTDGHPSVFAKKPYEMLKAMKQQKEVKYIADCSHWCLPGVPDTWNRLLYAYMVSNDSTDYSSDDKSDLVL